jgi:hypothetical protein
MEFNDFGVRNARPARKMDILLMNAKAAAACVIASGVGRAKGYRGVGF